MALLGTAPAGASGWLDPADVSRPGRISSNPSVAVDDAGNTIAVWERVSSLDTSHIVQFATRAPGGYFSAPDDLALRSTEPQVAIAPGGEAVAVWKHFENPPGRSVVQAAVRPPGGGFSPPVDVLVAEPGIKVEGLRLAMGGAGDAIVTWSTVDPDWDIDETYCDPLIPFLPFEFCPNPQFVEGSIRPAGGSFSPPERISEPRPPLQLTPLPGESPEEKEERHREEEEAHSRLTANRGSVAIGATGEAVAAWTYFDGTRTVTQAALRPPSGTFAPPVTVSGEAEVVGAPAAGIDASGEATVLWAREEGTAKAVQAARRPPGGGFLPPETVSSAGAAAEMPALAVGAGGTATAAWRLDGFGQTAIQAATRTPGAPFGKPQFVSNGNDNPVFPVVSMNAAGDTTIAWSADRGGKEVVRAVRRAAGQGFAQTADLSTPVADTFHPLAGTDAAGNATVLWANGATDLIQMAGYDSDPPQLRDVRIPATAVAGEAVELAATPVDAWPIGRPTFDFGDGPPETGVFGYHVYPSPGTYPVTITVGDAGGETATARGTIRVRSRGVFSLGALRRNRKRGTATLAVAVDGPGTVALRGGGIAPAAGTTTAASTLTLRIRAKGRGLRRLKKRGKLRSALTISFTPEGGSAGELRRTVVLRRVGG